MNLTKAKSSLRAYYSWISRSRICLSFYREFLNEETTLAIKALYLREVSLPFKYNNCKIHHRPHSINFTLFSINVCRKGFMIYLKI